MSLRTAKVLAILVVLGAAAGALCGALAVIPLAIQQAYWPAGDDGLIGSAASWLPLTMSLGAGLGSFLGPAVSVTLLRSIPLWRIFVIPTGAAIAGMFASWWFIHLRFLPDALTISSPLWLPSAAAVAASLWLRASSRGKMRNTVDLDARQ